MMVFIMILGTEYVNSIPIVIYVLLFLFILFALIIYKGKKYQKKKIIISSIVSFVIMMIILNRVICPKYWKYPDCIICDMDLLSIKKIWGQFDFVGPVKEIGFEESFQVVGYNIGKDENGADQYYFIYEHAYAFEDWEYDIWVEKGDRFIDNWFEYFSKGEAPRVYELQTYIDLYVVMDGKVHFDSALNGNEDEMLSYLGINRNDFLEMVFEQYPDF